MVIDKQLGAITLKATGATALMHSEVIQSLWSGYGKIVRCTLSGLPTPEPESNHPALTSPDPRMSSVVVKHVQWPTRNNHPRGWNTSRSHERKVKSYQVETAWYKHWSHRCGESCRVPACLALDTRGDEVFMVLEDLDASGFDGRRDTLTTVELHACLAWLANFHANFLGEVPEKLWTTGTYWHLETRPDELLKVTDDALRAAAPLIDRKLAESAFQTLVHGDAKVANFCFAQDGRVAAVDFQYVGGGCGMKDVAYFLSSCLSENECESYEQELLDSYFESLESALLARKKVIDFPALEANWRALYAFAWTDFFRFLQGWSPDHWKIHRYSKRLAHEVLTQL
ncbi:phosphotransferase [Congregibacter sp.]|uniref:phosphotransferase n=1 Tax=Congregibacter sp. TaxID=2744308 RepID=UPI0038596B07